MIDKITTVHRSKLGQRIGRVSTTEMLQLERDAIDNGEAWFVV
jgi:mRNA interferase MazF